MYTEPNHSTVLESRVIELESSDSSKALAAAVPLHQAAWGTNDKRRALVSTVCAHRRR